MKRKISNLMRGFCLTLLSTFSLVLSAQNVTLRGTVADVEGEPHRTTTVSICGPTLIRASVSTFVSDSPRTITTM